MMMIKPQLSTSVQYLHSISNYLISIKNKKEDIEKRNKQLISCTTVFSGL